MSNFGLPFFLEDTTGKLTGSEFVDLHNRMHLSLKQTLRDAHHTAYVIYDLSRRSATRGGLLVPLATLDFGAQNALGSIKIGDQEHIPMGHYLMKSAGSAVKSRKFKAADGQEYRWTLQTDGEWQCTNAKSNYHVATYSQKPAGEPQYPSSSGCMLTVEEAYPHLVGELLASLIVMRYIEQHNL
uniref:C3H1-type domain-containing protein n=1 Tax=Ganoderma boninense TaxID=34458 RepID=A0A5K1K8C2_9APHY|nr:C3H1-type domain-containing protein [Ganoderma boninense]